jgi:micrococcal nuclease
MPIFVFVFKFVFFIVTLAPVSTNAQGAFTVIYVIDGDTIDVQAQTGVLRVRLTGIDAPESCNEAVQDACKKRPAQPSGQLAKQSLRSLIEGKVVKLDCQPTLDRYGRTLCLVGLNGDDVGAAMLQAGFAWAYKSKYTPSNYRQLEQDARVKGVGLWGNLNPVRPSDWRRQCWSDGQC